MLNNLPINRIAEETADNTEIFAVSLSFIIAMLPHFLHLPLWVSGFALFALAWRAAQTKKWIWAMPKWLLVPLVLVGGISVFAQYWTIVGREPGLALLTVMASFKFLESRSHRDLLILIFLCYFLLATHFLFSQSIFIAMYMFIALIIITTTLITINQRDNTITLRDRFKASSKLIALSLPIMVILFILVPRIPGPIWGITQEQRGGVTGLSNTVSPGEISDLVPSNEVAFRVKFNGEVPAQDQLYWRGPVMAAFDGKTWRQAKHYKLQQINLVNPSEPITYTVTLEPNGRPWILALDIPTRILSGSYMSSEYQLISAKAVNDLKRYDLSSSLQYQLEPEESLDYLFFSTEVDEERNPKTIALGRQWAEQFDSEQEIIQQALIKFRTEEYIYTLKPPLLRDDPSDEFLFQTRRGFCEHYASSFALLMRAAGIPSRVVAGYQGGEYNEVGGYLIVRQSDAHAWTEVWLEDRGWIRIDPTAAVSPDRIEIGLEQALGGNTATFKIGKRNALVSRLMYNWDSLQNSWNDWVLNYDQYKQSRFLNRLGLGIRSWGDMVITLVISLLLITALYWMIGWYRERPPRLAKFEIGIQRILKKLARAGYVRAGHEPLGDFLARIAQEQNYHDPELSNIIRVYHKIKYARGYKTAMVLKRFSQMVISWKLVKPNS